MQNAFEMGYQSCRRAAIVRLTLIHVTSQVVARAVCQLIKTGVI